MDDVLKHKIHSRYTYYFAENYSEKYIQRLIIQEGFNQRDVEEVMKEIYIEKQKNVKQKNKYRSIINIILYIVGTAVLLIGIVFIILGNVYIGFASIFLAVIIWINANR